MSDNRNVRVSVIVPAYNVEEYIADTIQSAIESSAGEIEIIAIDDHSTDGTYEKLQKLAQAYPNIKLIRNNENKGVAAARNIGLELAEGKFIFFLDGDDLIERSALDRMYNAAIQKEADIVTGIYHDFSSRGHSIARLFLELPVLAIGGMKNILDYPEFFSFFFCWGKLYKKELLTKVRFNENLIISEDIPVAIYTYINSQKIYTLPEVVYYYRTRDGVSRSLTQTITPDTILKNSLMMWSEVQSFFEELDEDCKTSLQNHFTKVFILDEWGHLSRSILSEQESVRHIGLSIFNTWVSSLDSDVFLQCVNTLYNIMYKIERMLDVLDEGTKQEYDKLLNTIKHKLEEHTAFASKAENTKQIRLRDSVLIRVLENDFIGNIIETTHDYYERQDLDKFLKYIPSGSVIYDIGANIGNHTLFFSKYAEPQKIYAFEPNEVVVKLLESNLKDNKISNVEIIKAAVSDQNTFGSMSIANGNIGASHILYSETGTVRVVRLDDMNLEPPQFVKIDVENLEYEVINGMNRILLEHCPILWIEIRDKALVMVNQLLNKLNYEIDDRVKSDYDYSNYIYVPKKS